MALKYLLVICLILLSFVNCDKYLKEKRKLEILNLFQEVDSVKFFLAASLKTCYMHDAGFNKCLANNFQALFVEWKDGLPGLSSVGKIDPLLVKRINIMQDGSGPLSINMQLTNVVVTGSSKAIVQDTKLDAKTWKIEGQLYVPKLSFDADYKVKGKVLALSLNGAGKAKFHSDDVQMVIAIQMELRDDGDLTFTEIKSLRVVIKQIGNFHVRVDNLFNGQKDLEDAANNLFNENWRELYEILRPAIEQTVEKVLEDRFKKVFHYVPASYFIADIPKAAEVYG